MIEKTPIHPIKTKNDTNKNGKAFTSDPIHPIKTKDDGPWSRIEEIRSQFA